MLSQVKNAGAGHACECAYELPIPMLTPDVPATAALPTVNANGSCDSDYNIQSMASTKDGKPGLGHMWTRHDALVFAVQVDEEPESGQ